jgi:chromosome partitioning protein
MQAIAVANLKSGSGKSTTSLCLAVGAAQVSSRVLLIDADSQANDTSIVLDGRAPAEPTLSMDCSTRLKAHDAIRETRIKRLEMLPPHAKLADAALALANQLGRDCRLAPALRSLDGRYDLVIADAAPQLSLVSINVLNAVGELLLPVDAGAFSIAGLGRLQESVDPGLALP